MKKVITLISQQPYQDEIGQRLFKTTERNVIADISSVTLNEISGASQIGANAEYRAEIYAKEYHNEQYCKFDNKKYHVYRVYLSGRKAEIYLEEVTL